MWALYVQGLSVFASSMYFHQSRCQEEEVCKGTMSYQYTVLVFLPSLIYQVAYWEREATMNVMYSDLHVFTPTMFYLCCQEVLHWGVLVCGPSALIFLIISIIRLRSRLRGR